MALRQSLVVIRQSLVMIRQPLLVKPVELWFKTGRAGFRVVVCSGLID